MRWTRAGAGSLAAATIAALIYGRTLAPSVGAGDSGELVLAAQSLGIPHPPGYPLWVVLARLAAWVPAGDVAWRVNALSALLTAVAAGLVFLLAMRVGLGGLRAALATMLYAGSSLVWHSAVEAEVYPLASVFFLLLALLAIRARSTSIASPRTEASYFFVAGLSVIVHQTLLFPAVAFGVWVLARDARLVRVVAGAAWILLGFSFVLVVPLRMATHAAFSWGGESSIQSLFDHMLRRNYGGLQQNPMRLDLIVGELGGMGAIIVAALGLPGVVLATLGWLRGSEERRRIEIIGLAGLTIPVALVAILAFTPDAEHLAQIAPFLAPVVVALSLAAGVGAGAALSLAPTRWRAPAAAALLAVVLVSVWPHYAACDRSDFRLAERYGRDLLRDLPSGSVLIVDGDNETFLAAYATRVERYRTDVTLIHRRGYVFGDPYGLRGVPRAKWAEVAHRVDLERLDTSEWPIYYATPPPDLAASGVTFVPQGLVYRALAPARDRGKSRSGVPRADESPAIWLPPANWRKSSDLLAGDPRKYDYVTRKLAISYSDAAAGALWSAGRIEEAYPWFADAAAVGFDFVGARLNLSTVAAATERPEVALSELLTARGLAPREAEPAARMAVFLSAAGRHRDAALWFEKAYGLGPARALATDAARAWTLAGDVERARLWRERAG